MIDPFSKYEEVMASLKKQGAFLTVKSRGGLLNTMTIGWSLLGIIWQNPVCMVAVRSSRYTSVLLEDADDFTVTVPLSQMHDQLVFCGTHSGRNMDKFKECNLETLPAQKIDSPIIAAKNARCYECKIVQVTAMDKDRIDLKYDQDLYQDQSHHSYYFGEIVACYEI